MLKLIIKNLYPPKCLSCACDTETYDSICYECFNNIFIIKDPFCDTCAEPFENGYPEGACEYCTLHQPIFDKARAAFYYEGSTAQMVAGLKFRDKTNNLKFLSDKVYFASADIIDEVDIITAVPIHWRRLFKRKFNQSILIAREVAKLANLPSDFELIKRVKHTPPQASLNRNKRKDNILNAFKVAKEVKGKTILVIDDVMTTGSTLSEIARVLKLKGAKKVYVACIAKTILS